MSVDRQPWGETSDGRSVERIELRSSALTLGILTWAATVQSLRVADRNGVKADVVLGFDDLAGYLADHPWIGATAGRYANRIADGTFVLDGIRYQVPRNDGANTLHGGPEGFHRRLWECVAVEEQEDGGVAELHLRSPNHDMGFPGELSVTMRFAVHGAEVRLETTAVTSAATVVTLTNHAYFNLSGDPARSIAEHTLQVGADNYVAVDEAGIPLAGSPATVDSTAFDLRSPRMIGEAVLDNTYVLGAPGELHTAAVLTEPTSGRQLTVRTTEPGVQVYTGDHLDGSLVGRGGIAIGKRSGICLETQHYPNSPNRPDFPSTVLRPDQKLHSVTAWEFAQI